MSSYGGLLTLAGMVFMGGVGYTKVLNRLENIENKLKDGVSKADLTQLEERTEFKLAGFRQQMQSEVAALRKDMQGESRSLRTAIDFLAKKVRLSPDDQDMMQKILPKAALVWGGQTLLHPSPRARCLAQDLRFVCLVNEDTSVYAAAAGKVAHVSESAAGKRVELVFAGSAGTMIYDSLSTVIAREGDLVEEGQIIGDVRTNRPDPFESRFTLELLRKGKAVEPPASAQAYRSLGHRVYAGRCARCHETEGMRTPLIRDGLLPSGMAANDENIRYGIIHGSERMPAFGTTLTRGEQNAVIEFLKANANPEMAAAEVRVSRR